MDPCHYWRDRNYLQIDCLCFGSVLEAVRIIRVPVHPLFNYVAANLSGTQMTSDRPMRMVAPVANSSLARFIGACFANVCAN